MDAQYAFGGEKPVSCLGDYLRMVQYCMLFPMFRVCLLLYSRRLFSTRTLSVAASRII
jgi:hypothetical protein